MAEDVLPCMYICEAKANCSLSVSMHVLKKEDTCAEMSAISSKTYKKDEKVCRLLNEQEVLKATELMVFDKSAGVNTGGFEPSYNMSALYRVSSESLWAQSELCSELFDIKLQLCANYEAYFGQGTKVTVLGDTVVYVKVKVFTCQRNKGKRVRQRGSRESFCDSGKSLCSYSEAYFGAGTKLTVLEPDHNVTTPTVTVFPPSANECRNQKDPKRRKTLVCVASGFYPDHVSVSWQVGGGAVSSGVATDSSALREGKTYRISSRLRVSASDWFTLGRKFTCRVSFFNGTHTNHYENTVEGVQGKEGVMTREKYLKTTQAAKLSYVVFIVKSSVYGAGVAFLLWRLQSSAGKQNN
ncbi:hypothetical protein JOQ06_002056 [Pogonophryne albipinna]|uniref:Ig-like domain-containing protein n=1 Tax=Pogonophryne albipinna TaxID=1090488 RepID=A0AAD6F2E7_9TELE|nr:hypothetical protein JOQ06_002056 [Pogonophryne albipinna]